MALSAAVAARSASSALAAATSSRSAATSFASRSTSALAAASPWWKSPVTPNSASSSDLDAVDAASSTAEASASADASASAVDHASRSRARYTPNSSASVTPGSSSRPRRPATRSASLRSSPTPAATAVTSSTTRRSSPSTASNRRRVSTAAPLAAASRRRRASSNSDASPSPRSRPTSDAAAVDGTGRGGTASSARASVGVEPDDLIADRSRRRLQLDDWQRLHRPFASAPPAGHPRRLPRRPRLRRGPVPPSERAELPPADGTPGRRHRRSSPCATRSPCCGAPHRAVRTSPDAEPGRPRPGDASADCSRSTASSRRVTMAPCLALTSSSWSATRRGLVAGGRHAEASPAGAWRLPSRRR